LFSLGANIVKDFRQLAMRQKPPAQRLAFGMQGHLEDAVSALHPRCLVFVRIFLERAHLDLPYSVTQ
jgi:hypothetical protein